MRRDDSQTSSFLSSTVITTFVASRNFLLIGCATCDNNNGWLYLYNPLTLKLLKGIPGGNGYTSIGLSVSARVNTDDTE